MRGLHMRKEKRGWVVFVTEQMVTEEEGPLQQEIGDVG